MSMVDDAKYTIAKKFTEEFYLITEELRTSREKIKDFKLDCDKLARENASLERKLCELTAQLSKASENLLLAESRSEEITCLQSKLSKLKTTLEGLEDDKVELREEVTKLSSLLAEAQIETKNYQNDLEEARNQMKRNSTFNEILTGNLSQLESECSLIKRQFQTLKKSHCHLEENVSSAKMFIQQLTTQNNELTAVLARRDETEEALKTQLIAAKAELADFMQSSNPSCARLGQTSAHVLGDLNIELDEKSRRLEEALVEINDLSEKKQILHRDLAETQKLLSRSIQAEKYTSEARRQLQTRFDRLEEANDSLREENDKLNLNHSEHVDKMKFQVDNFSNKCVDLERKLAEQCVSNEILLHTKKELESQLKSVKPGEILDVSLDQCVQFDQNASTSIVEKNPVDYGCTEKEINTEASLIANDMIDCLINEVSEHENTLGHNEGPPGRTLEKHDEIDDKNGFVIEILGRNVVVRDFREMLALLSECVKAATTVLKEQTLPRNSPRKAPTLSGFFSREVASQTIDVFAVDTEEQSPLASLALAEEMYCVPESQELIEEDQNEQTCTRSSRDVDEGIQRAVSTSSEAREFTTMKNAADVLAAALLPVHVHVDNRPTDAIQPAVLENSFELADILSHDVAAKNLKKSSRKIIKKPTAGNSSNDFHENDPCLKDNMPMPDQQLDDFDSLLGFPSLNVQYGIAHDPLTCRTTRRTASKPAADERKRGPSNTTSNECMMISESIFDNTSCQPILPAKSFKRKR